MELVLHVDLTDEQYKDLMNKSFDKIFEDPAVVGSMQTIILNSMEKWIESNPQFFLGYFSNVDGYRATREMLNETSRKLVDLAGQEAADTIKKKISTMMLDTVNDPALNLESMVMNILIRGIMEGVTHGMRDWQLVSTSTMNQITEIMKRHNLAGDHEVYHVEPYNTFADIDITKPPKED